MHWSHEGKAYSKFCTVIILKGINESSSAIKEFEVFIVLMKHFILIEDDLQGFRMQYLHSPTTWKTSWMAGILAIDLSLNSIFTFKQISSITDD